MDENKNNRTPLTERRNSEEERPLVELPALVFFLMLLFSFCIGCGLLFLSPLILVVVFLSLAIAVGIFFDPFVGILVFLAGAYLHPTAHIPGLQQFHLARNLGFLVLIMWWWHIIIYRDFVFIRSKQLLYIAGYVFVGLMACLKYWDFSSPIFFEQGIKLTVLFFIITNLVKSRKQAIVLIWTLVVCGVIAALIGIYQHVFHVGQIYYEGKLRIVGTEEDPNFFALDLAITVALVFGLLWSQRNIFVRMLCYLFLMILLSTILLTYSRTGLVTVFFVWMLSVTYPIFHKPRRLTPLLVSLVVIMSLIPFVPESYWERARSITDFKDIAISSRLGAWTTGLAMIVENPIRGIGFGVFKFEYIQRAMSVSASTGLFRRAMAAHNAYIELTAEAGIFALLLFIILIFYSVKDYNRAQKNFSRDDDLLFVDITRGLKIGLFAFLVGSMFLSTLHLLIIWIIISLSVVFLKISEPA